VAAAEGYGAHIVLHGATGLEAFAKMEELQRERGLTLVHPYDDEAIIAGHGTLGLEVMSDLPDVDVVIVPVGGGGLISGVATAVKALRPEARVVGVEPEGAACVRRALDEGQVVRLETTSTIADGLAAPFTSDRVLAHVNAFVDDVVTVTDSAIREALAALLARTKLLVEPAGAASLAALMSGAVRVNGNAQVAIVASGGNVDLHRLKELLP
jgi:threonine dehydratase